MPIDCNAPDLKAGFQGDVAKCQLITTCQRRFESGIPVPDDIKAACTKALADWKASEAAKGAAAAKPQDDAIRSLLKK